MFNKKAGHPLESTCGQLCTNRKFGGSGLDSGAIDSMTIVKLARCVTQTTKI